MTTNYKPENFHTLTPNLICKNAPAAIGFYKNAFDAKELMRLEYADGKIGHAEIMIGDSPVMVSDEHPDQGCLSPQTIGGSPITMHLYVPDADAFFARAIAAGATQLSPVEEQFYGDRAGRLQDPYGYRWHIATATKKLTPEEMQQVWRKLIAGN
jgi:PhnB protein